MTLETRAARNRQNRFVPDAGGAAQSARSSWLLCRIGTALGALQVEHVVEIMRMLPIERIAGAPCYVLGLSIIRGVPAPVVDVGRLIGGAPSHAAQLVTVKAAARKIALAVDEAIGIVRIAADTFGELPPLLQDAATETISGLATLDSELVVFLRTSRLVPEGVLARLDADGARS